MASRLRDATSPYLQQHATNPVDWWPWGPDAFAEARRRDVPVLLSVGYSACHWCHVMAHESFEDEAVARVLNARVVPVKVDREERPDVDSVYMAAVLAMTGHGGWPMTCFLTPDGAPFHAGTYYPAHQLVPLVVAASDAWRERRDEVLTAAGQLVDAIAPPAARGGAEVLGAAGERLVSEALARLATQYDAQAGGFGRAPKFPPSMVLEWLLRHHERTGSATALEMAAGTLRAMAAGGMHDQVGGGFARYAVDATWTVPHFEKMLYDNAQLLRAYVHWWRLDQDPAAERVARGIVRWLDEEMRTPEGAFVAGLDADTGRVEGATYVWTPDELVDVLGPVDGTWAASALGVTAAGTFEHGTSVLQRRDEPDEAGRLDLLLSRLREARARRPQPARDDKVVASWNGLAIGALSEAAMVLHEPGWLDLARSAADHVLDDHVVQGRLVRTSRDGVPGDADGVLDDHGNLAEGLLLLAEATGQSAYLEAAGQLLDAVLERFPDGAGGFYDTPADGEVLVVRPAETTDGAEPSGRSAAASALLRYAAHTGSARHHQAGIDALQTLAPPARRAPRFAGWSLATAESLLAGSPEVAVTPGSGAGALVAAAWAGAAPGQVTVHDATHPLLTDRPPAPDGSARAFVCRHRACSAPVTDPGELAERLRS